MITDKPNPRGPQLAARRVRPADARELAAALREADEAGLAVVPHGAGAQQYVGNPPSRVDVILETRALDGIVEHTPADLTVTVRAGARLADLQAALGAAGQRLTLDPPHALDATIGGLIATNASGPRRAKYGTLRDLVIGMRVALVDGTIARAGGKVVKNVAGYDLNKLYIGSLGTLGVIVEATFKVLPLPAQEAALAARFVSLRRASEAAVAIAHTGLRPAALEAHDLDDDPRLVVVADGHEPAVERVLAETSRIAREYGARSVDRASDVETALAPSRGLIESEALILRASVPLAAQGPFVDEIRRIAHDRTAGVALAAHAGNGIVRARLSGEAEAVSRAAVEMFALAKTVEGDAWCERVPDALRDVVRDAWFGEPPGFFLMRRIKREFDPRDTLNPGRFVGGI
jgi:glycolate oxidase FAD binding subunit